MHSDIVSFRFSDFNGEMLFGLHNVMKDAPEYFFKTLKEEYDFSLKDSVQFSVAFKKLKWARHKRSLLSSIIITPWDGESLYIYTVPFIINHIYSIIQYLLIHYTA